METQQAIDELQELREKFRTTKRNINGAEYLRAEWNSEPFSQVVKEGGVWLPVNSEQRMQDGFIFLFDSVGAFLCPERPHQDYQYSESLKPAADAFRQLAREGGDILARNPTLECVFRPFACGPNSIAGLGRWWFALLFRHFANPPTSHDYENNGQFTYDTTLRFDVFTTSELGCGEGIELLTGTKPKSGGLSLDDYNDLAIQEGMKDGTFKEKPNVRRWAEKLGCSTGLVPQLPFYILCAERAGTRKKGKPPKPKIVSLEAVADDGEHDEQLERLIGEQRRDDEPSPLEADAPGRTRKVRSPKTL